MPFQSNVTKKSEYFTGTDKTLRFTITDDDDQPVDMTGWALSWVLKNKAKDTDEMALIHKVTPGGIDLAGAAAGVALVPLTDDDIAIVRSGKVYAHELKRTNPGAEDVLSYGTFEFNQSAHRD